MEALEKLKQLIEEGDDLVKKGMDSSDPVFREWVSRVKELIDNEF